MYTVNIFSKYVELNCIIFPGRLSDFRLLSLCSATPALILIYGNGNHPESICQRWF